MKKTVVSIVALCGTVAACAAELALIEDGVAKCRVEIPADATPSERLAKKELEKYLSLATGCGALAGDYPIVVKERREGSAIPEDSFGIDVTPTRMTIVGANDRGVMYGVYEVLKRYAGMRWVTPGDDGEYCVHKGGTVKVPVGRETQKPFLRIRKTIGDDVNAAFWHARNGMQTSVGAERYMSAREVFEGLGARGGFVGGHIMSDLLIGGRRTDKDRVARRDALFAAHPEYFPLMDGERVKILSPFDPNPCVSNPAVLDRMAENLLALIEGSHAADDYVTIGNNDTTRWCTCDACRALDPPEARNSRGELSDRYWFVVNEIARRVWAKRPDAKFGGWAYQNFWFAPVHVKPDPRLQIMVSFNNQCWRHACIDPKCPVNATMAKIFTSWKKLGLPLVINRDEIGAWDGSGSPGCEMEPAESILVKNIRSYPEIGCGGSSFCVNTPFPEFSKFATKWAPYFGKRYHWYAMWQTCYMAARTMWNPELATEAALEEANRLYYGEAAWEAGMSEFRTLLTKCFLSTPGCIGWGQGASIGRCLDVPGSEERLTAMLEKALAAAKASGDARAERHVAREKEIFELTWLKARRNYVANYREMTAYRRTGEIVVDGVLDELDWRTADSYSNFAMPAWLKKRFDRCERTYLKVVYDRDHLYFGVVAMEPHPEKIVAGDRVDRRAEGVANLGDHIELFYSYPDMAQAAWHLMINSKGQIIDALQKSTTDRDTSFATKAKWAVKVSPDCWTLEVAVPCSEIGQNIMDGMTWKLNCARVRLLDGMERSELSSAANGNFHGTENFVNVKFVPKRTGTGAKDESPWKNSGLNDLEVNNNRHPNFRWKKWRSVKTPRHWHATGAGETKEHPDSQGDYYVSFSSGEFSQYYVPVAAGDNVIRFRARGRGTVSMVVVNYTKHPDPEAQGLLQLRDIAPAQPTFNLTPEWTEHKLQRKSLGKADEKISIRFLCGKDSVVELDDICVSPCETKKVYAIIPRHEDDTREQAHQGPATRLSHGDRVPRVQHRAAGGLPEAGACRACGVSPDAPRAGEFGRRDRAGRRSAGVRGPEVPQPGGGLRDGARPRGLRATDACRRGRAGAG